MDTIEKSELLATTRMLLDSSGDGLEDQLALAGNETILFPKNGNSVTFQVILKYSNGSPAPGKTVQCRSEVRTLAGAEWRTVNQLAPRFGRGEARIRERVASETIRLSARVVPAVATTDANGVASFRVDAFHVCGNDASPASDHIIATSEAGESRAIVACAVEGMAALVDDEAGGMTTSGLVGRHLIPEIISVLKAIGQAWQKVGNKPPGMPNYITITGASLRWGGLNPPHMTHRFGGTADVRPIGTKVGQVSVGDAHYHREATAIIVDYLRQTGATEIRFADNLPGVTAVDSDHKNHIHASWLKKPDEPWFTSVSDGALRSPTGAL